MLKLSHLFMLGAALFLSVPHAQAVEKAQVWELVNPAGVIKQAQVDPAKRITALDGKTIALRWNGKHNGDVVLDRIAELMSKNILQPKLSKHTGMIPV